MALAEEKVARAILSLPHCSCRRHSDREAGPAQWSHVCRLRLDLVEVDVQVLRACNEQQDLCLVSARSLTTSTRRLLPDGGGGGLGCGLAGGPPPLVVGDSASFPGA